MDDVVKILGTGLSGLGFLLMYLAYGLLRTIINKPTQASDSTLSIELKSVNRYMALCLIMTITVGVFTVVNTFYKNEELTNKDQVISGYSGLQQSDTLSRVAAANKNDPAKLKAILKKQDTALSHVQNIIKKTGDTGKLKAFKTYQNFVLSYADSVEKAGNNKAKVDSLTLKYNRYNKSIKNIALQSLSTGLKN